MEGQGNRILGLGMVGWGHPDWKGLASMTDHADRCFLRYFATVPDPRVEYLCDHKLIDIIAIAICAVTCGADGWVEVEAYGRAKAAWLGTFLELPHGIPSHDTFGRVFALLDTTAFERAFMGWVQDIVALTAGQVIAIDGKTLRRSHDAAAGRGPLHLVSAWAAANGVVLGQVRVDQKSNEITAIPVLLEMLDLAGQIVTVDAMGCQKAIAQQILDRGGDYLLAVKDNQPRLHAKVQEAFAEAEAQGYAHTAHDAWERVEKGHGRIERRRCTVLTDTDHLLYIQGTAEGGVWPGLRALVRVEAERRMGAKTQRQTRYYITSLGGDAREAGLSVREHWGIENRLHWVLDIAFREDESRIRVGNGPHLFSVLRRLALNLLKRERTAKGGIHAKRLRAAWDHDYLLKVLRG